MRVDPSGLFWKGFGEDWKSGMGLIKEKSKPVTDEIKLQFSFAKESFKESADLFASCWEFEFAFGAGAGVKGKVGPINVNVEAVYIKQTHSWSSGDYQQRNDATAGIQLDLWKDKVGVSSGGKIMKKQDAVGYCRLSKDDDIRGGESASISSQKEIIEKYARDNGWHIRAWYIDDGFSGTNFKRPDFLRMIDNIEDGEIGIVITKDLSRLGRDYLKTGYYTDVYFPENNVRYIAVNDGIDTQMSDNDIAPFKNILKNISV